MRLPESVHASRPWRIQALLPDFAVEDVWALAPDGRTIYYGSTRVEADIWIAEKK
jgi:hypothetical protein